MNPDKLQIILEKYFKRAGDIRLAVEKGKIRPEHAVDIIDGCTLEVKVRILNLNEG